MLRPLQLLRADQRALEGGARLPRLKVERSQEVGSRPRARAERPDVEPAKNGALTPLQPIRPRADRALEARSDARREHRSERLTAPERPGGPQQIQPHCRRFRS